MLSVSPLPDTEIARLTLLEVTFDQPMEPTGYGLKPVDPVEHPRQAALIGQPDYHPEKHRFTMRVSLPADWNGELVLQGFRGLNGNETDPIVLKYRTRRRIVSETLQAEIERASQPTEEFRRLVQKVRDARRKLTSVKEEILTIGTVGSFSPDWDQRYDCQGSRFAMQGETKFLGEVDAIMGIPFRVGSDGERCWWRGGDKQASVPFESVTEKNIAICDAFEAIKPADAAQIIRDRKLQYAGEAVVRERRCHRVRSWNLDTMSSNRFGTTREWSIDAESFLPARVETLLIGVFRNSYAIEFTHSHINQPIPDEEFRPPADLGAPKPDRAVEPPIEGCTGRFLNVKDGSDGRMSVRWGMTGPKGTTSSGLN